ncbi:hypothetical protein FHL15_001118 [Xylaria flabelliformis]|uniref:PD-(D/E)XK nuclease-like domain-containing protein n=1 Tax=Xylaria flabelliformis TaxID=2512241 RepID=A0A553ICH5_9PEZI|nr:hypothetical protein FHL15_001118 [Xylaria flabelliformis]
MFTFQITRWIDSVNHYRHNFTLNSDNYHTSTPPASQSQESEPYGDDDCITDGDTVVNTSAGSNSDSLPSTLSWDASISQEKRGHDDMDPRVRFRSEWTTATKLTEPTFDRQHTLGEKPVFVEHLHYNRDKIPEDMVALCANIYKADPYKQVVPHDVFHGRSFRHPGQGQTPDNLTALQLTLKSIVDSAWVCYQMGRSVACWNHLVYTPLLNLGFGFNLGPFISLDMLDEETQKPAVAGSDIYQTRGLHRSFNPTAISIAARTDPTQPDPLVRLGIWITARHEYLMGIRKHGTELQKSMLVPVIKICDHNWIMYFACDSAYSVDVYGPIRLGSTHSLLDACTLITTLQYLKKWIKGHFHEGNIDYCN